MTLTFQAAQILATNNNAKFISSHGRPICPSHCINVAIMSSATPAQPTSAATTESKLFAVRAMDRADSSALRATNRPAHLEWVTQPEHGVVFGGPIRYEQNGPTKGSLLLVRATDHNGVRQMLCGDPYARAQLFAHVDIRQWVCGMRSETPLPAQLFMVWCVDRADAMPLRKETRPRHLHWWKSANRAGMIGPFPCENGAVGSLIVCEGDSLEEVTQWTDTDPYKIAGVFETVHVAYLTKVLETEEAI